jgi:hypothetical protein
MVRLWPRVGAVVKTLVAPPISRPYPARMTRKFFLPAGMLSVACAFLAAGQTVRAQGVTVVQTNDRVRVELNGELFTEYWFTRKQHPAIVKNKDGSFSTNAARKAYFYPLIGPGGAQMTRSWPMREDVPGEEKDHQHHRGLWFSHGSVNGVDFWSETPKAGKIQHDQFVELKGGEKEGVIKATSKWVAPDGKVVCTDERTFRVYNTVKNERLFDFEITIKAPADRDVLFGDTKEGTMAVRVNEQMRLSHGKGKAGKGRIVQSTGVRDGQTWGKRAEWCDYSGPVDGKVVGIAIFDHPSNPVHPTYWHVRDYGLFAANPFGIHDFEKKAPGTGNLNIPAGQSVTFRYRFYIHEGDEKEAKVAERYKEYVASVAAK